MRAMRVLVGTIVALAGGCFARAQNTFSGNAEITLQFSPSSPEIADHQIEVQITADLAAVRTAAGITPVLTAFSMPVGFDPSHVRLISATAGSAQGYSPAGFAYTEPPIANARGVVALINSRSGNEDPGTQIELGRLLFEIVRPGTASFIAGTARTTHPGSLAAVPKGSASPVQRIPWSDRTYSLRIRAGTSIPSLLCPSWSTTADVFQGMALLNAGTDTASIQMFGWNPDGTLFQASSVTNPSSPMPLPGLNQDAKLTEQIFSSSAAIEIKNGWIEVRSDTPDIEGFFLQGVNDGALTRQMDGVPLTYTPGARLIFPLIRNPVRKTEISLVNPGSVPVGLELRVFEPSGDSLIQTQAPSHGSFRYEIPYAPEIEGGYVDVQASGGKIVGVERFGTDESFAALSGQDAELAANRLVGPQFASGNLGNDLRIDTHIALVNPSNSPTVVVLRLLDDNGQEISSPVVRNLYTGDVLSTEGWTLFGLPNPALSNTLITGSLIVESDLGILGAMSFGDPVEGRFLSALPLMSSASAKREIYFGQVAVGTLGYIDYFTGLALVNPSPTDTARIQMELHAKDGRILAETTTPYELGPGKRTATLVQHLIPDFPAGQFGGYIRLISNVEMHAYMLIGDNYYNFLSAVP